MKIIYACFITLCLFLNAYANNIEVYLTINKEKLCFQYHHTKDARFLLCNDDDSSYQGVIVIDYFFKCHFIPLLISKDQNFVIEDIAVKTCYNIDELPDISLLEQPCKIRFEPSDFYELGEHDIFNVISEAISINETKIKLYKKLFNFVKERKKSLHAYSLYQEFTFTHEIITSRIIPNKNSVLNNRVNIKHNNSVTTNYKQIIKNINKHHITHDLTLEEIKNIFKQLRRSNPVLFDNNTLDGHCYIIAHMVCDYFIGLGYEINKIWIAGNLTNPNSLLHSWRYHVSACIYYKENNKEQFVILDPVLSNKIMKKTRWINKLSNNKPIKLYYPLPTEPSRLVYAITQATCTTVNYINPYETTESISELIKQRAQKFGVSLKYFPID